MKLQNIASAEEQILATGHCVSSCYCHLQQQSSIAEDWFTSRCTFRNQVQVWHSLEELEQQIHKLVIE
uniref:Uncharacterized protein n=1 Tax=Arundo donax TaxID=35708 RepID=A0A0A9H6C9_ARUDO